MRNIFLITLILISLTTYGQTPFPGGIRLVDSDSITQTDTLVLMNKYKVLNKWVRGRNLPVKDVTINNYSHNGTLFSYLQGIDLALGAIQETTAGVLTRINFTGDETTIASGTYYLSNFTDKGSVASVSQTVNNGDNTKTFFTQDIISDAGLLTDTAEKGSYTASLSVSTESAGAGNDYSQRFTIEIYLTDNDGVPIPSGVIGAPTGDLGVTVLTILDSGVLNMPYDAITNITLTGALNEDVDLLVGNRIRYHISAEKIGTNGGAVNQKLYLGSDHSSYYDVPTPIFWGTIKGNLSNQVDLQNALDAKEDVSNKGIADGYASLDTNGKVPLSQISDALLGAVNYQGTWNASTNTPTLVSPPDSSTKGHYYTVTADGTQFGIDFFIEDIIISDGNVWDRIPGTDRISSVFGRIGDITALEEDYSSFYVSKSGDTMTGDLIAPNFIGNGGQLTNVVVFSPSYDLNNPPTNSVGFSFSNSPTGVSETSLVFGSTNTLYITQLLGRNDKLHFRTKENGVFTPLREVIHTGNISDYAGLPVGFYEEGTFTPTLVDDGGGATYSFTIDEANYIRQGNSVFFNIRLLSINTTGTPVGILELGNLPFNISTNTNPISISAFVGSDVSSSNLDRLSARVTTSDYILFKPVSSAGVINVVTFSSGVIEVSGTYTTNVYTP